MSATRIHDTHFDSIASYLLDLLALGETEGARPDVVTASAAQDGDPKFSPSEVSDLMRPLESPLRGEQEKS